MAAPKTSLNPKPRPRTKTKEKTLRGRPVWIDNTGEVTGEKGAKYSEVTTTIPWGTEWITAPSIDENGKRLSDDEVKQKLIDTLGKDFITGEKLPTFSNPEKASEYAQWRSDTMFDQEAIEQGFPEEFPMGPEPERKDLIDRSIDKGKDFLEYLTTPSKHGVFNQGGDVAAQTDNLFGYTDKAVTKEVDKYKEDVNTELSFKDVATFVAEATPIIGDALAAKEIYDELQKDDPNYLLVGALGGAALVGLIPGLGDAAASVIKTGAKKALDTAKRIEVDPNALGSMGGNINLTPKAANSPDEPKNYAYRTDNPATKGYEGGEEWLESKQKTAEDRAKNSSEENSTGKLLSGSITGYMGQDFKRPLFLSTEMLSKLKGANDEKRYVGEGRYDLLRKRVDKEGFDPEQKYSSEDDYGNAIVIGVNHKGEAFIIEGNTRVAVAKDLDVPSIRAEVKYYNGAEEVDGPYSPQNIIQYADKPKDFNKGGAVMNEQMEMAFMQQGGLKDDGMKRDPVSGNEVPNGSMAKEVRDDIPAQLSEGEYVVPADVVRYLGVKHFEDLRDKAKQGLQSMEANGRIGGEPVPVGGPQAAPMAPPQMAMGGDLSPEEMNEINSIMMAQGGMVLTDPYQQQQMQYTQPMAQGAAEGADFSYYNPGGMTTEQAITTPTKYTGEFSFEEPVGITDTEVPVENKASCEARGMVYNPDTKMCETPAPVPERVGGDGSSSTPPTTPGTPGTPGSFDVGFKNWGSEVDWTDPESVEKFVTGQYNMPDPALRKGAGVVGLLGAGPLAAVGTVGSIFMAGQVLDTVADLRTSVMIAKAYGNTEGAAIAQAKLDAALKGAPSYVTSSFGDIVAPGTRQFAGHVSGASGLDDLPSDIDAWTENDFTRFQSAVGSKGGKKAPVTSEPTRSDDDRPTVVPGTPPPSAAGTGGGARPPRRPTGDDPGPSGAEVARAAAASSVARSEGVSAPTSGGARSVSAPKSETKGTGKKETYASKVERGGGFNKGGLASRPKKKK